MNARKGKFPAIERYKRELREGVWDEVNYEAAGEQILPFANQ